MDFLKCLKKDIEIERILLERFKDDIMNYPEGRLNGKRINGKQKFYQIKDDGTIKHISRENKALMIALRTKGILLKSIKILKKNMKWQEKLLQHYEPYDIAAVEQRLPGAYSESRLREWSKQRYRMNPYYVEYKIFQTSFGLMVRSKSEVLIAELLYAFGILFHYDEEILVRDAEGFTKSYYVDFVIMTPSGRIIYWEHMGRFDEDGYRNHNLEKFCLYFDNGLVLGDNLIITMESKKSGLSAKKIVEIIKAQILPYFE